MPSMKSIEAISEQAAQSAGTAVGREYWRSLDEFAQTPEFLQYVENEFPTELENVLTPSNRRTFLKLMGASLALAGAGLPGCRRWPDEKIAPFARRPEDYVPGEPVEFATALEFGGHAEGLIATTFDGRPVKLEGNQNHPINGGTVRFLPGAEPMAVAGTGTFVQAQILEFYDPERSQVSLRRTNPGQPDAQAEVDPGAVDSLRTVLEASRGRAGAGLAILHEATGSPTFHSLKRQLASSLGQARWHEWEPVSRENEVEGARLAFGGAGSRAHYDLTKASVIVSLDSDLLEGHPAAVKHARDFAARRRHPENGMSRFYSVESTVSVTGTNADHRLRARSSDVAGIAASIAAALGANGVSVLGADQFSSSPVDEFVSEAAHDLAGARGESLVVAGPRQPAEVHALVHAINFALGNVGNTVNYTAEPLFATTGLAGHTASIRALADACRAGEVNTLVIIGGNPVYDAPADVRFADAISRVGNRIHLSVYDNETSALCHQHITRAHALESWGDVMSWDGTVSIVQPLIEPLYGGLTPIELLAMMAGEGHSAQHLVEQHFAQSIGSGDARAAWRTALHDGVVANSQLLIDNESVRMQAGEWAQSLSRTIQRSAGNDEIEVVFAADPCVYDGRFANNGWLQELPHPTAKICWDNAAFMSPATAQALGVRGDDLVAIDFPGARSDEDPLEVAVHVIPGHADNSITLNLGYGRTRAGHVGNEVGFNVYPWRKSGAMHFVGGVDVRKAGGRYPLATIQDHHAMDSAVTRARIQEALPGIVRQARLDRFVEEGEGAFFPPGHHGHELPIVSLWENNSMWNGRKHAWALAIDLNACTGCSTCIVACQAENNIPIVGKDQVRRGREMHWIRVDRYFKGTNTNDPEVLFQPVTCQHCENAPCEQVCPVAATVHDKEGLNVMVYNRCVGTRYCSNNCPYKVRRFNFYDWWVEDPRVGGLKPPTLKIPDEATQEAFEGENLPLQMAMNPEVTVRPRGVMEKCSFCVQRINRAKINAKNAWAAEGGTTNGSDDYDIADGTVTPACAQACPSQALIFGDLMNPDSRVAHFWDQHESPRSYALLNELNTRPRTRFLGKVRNYNDTLSPKPVADHHDDLGSNGGPAH